MLTESTQVIVLVIVLILRIGWRVQLEEKPQSSSLEQNLMPVPEFNAIVASSELAGSLYLLRRE